MSYHDVVEVICTKKFYKQVSTVLLSLAFVGGLSAVIYSPLTLWAKIAVMAGMTFLLGISFHLASYLTDQEISISFLWGWENAFLALLFIACIISAGLLMK